MVQSSRLSKAFTFECEAAERAAVKGNRTQRSARSLLPGLEERNRQHFNRP